MLNIGNDLICRFGSYHLLKPSLLDKLYHLRFLIYRKQLVVLTYNNIFYVNEIFAKYQFKNKQKNIPVTSQKLSYAALTCPEKTGRI